MISRDDARRIYTHPHSGSCRCIKPTQHERDLAETVLSLYEDIDELETIIEKAAHDQCGCLGGSCRLP